MSWTNKLIGLLENDASPKRIAYYREHFPFEVAVVGYSNPDERHDWCLETIGPQARYHDPRHWLARPEIEEGEWAGVCNFGQTFSPTEPESFYFFKDELYAIEFKLKFG